MVDGVGISRHPSKIHCFPDRDPRRALSISLRMSPASAMRLRSA